MGFSIGSVFSEIKSVVTDPGKLVSEAANSILPGNMKVVGDILGGIADINSGSPLAALSHLTDALKDLPQLLQGLSGAAGASKPAGTAAAEPSPPPTRTTPSTAAESTSSAPAPTPQSPKVNVQTFGKETIMSIDDGTRTTVIVEKPGQKPLVSVHTDRGPAAGGSAPAAGPGKTDAASPASTPPASTPAPGALTGALAASTIPADTEPASTKPSGTAPAAATPAGTTAATPQAPKVNVQRIGRETITSIDDGARTTVIVQRPGHRPIVGTHADSLPKLAVATAATGTVAAPSTKPAATSSGSASVAETSDSSSSTGAGGTGAPATASSASSNASGAATPADLQSLMAMSPDQFLAAVTGGKIPDSVANSQSAMMQVQARMNQITQMNQLVTGMMAAMHQMEMSIIQNIRC